MAISWLACFGVLAFWCVLASLGVALSRRTATPAEAFRRTASALFIAVGLFPGVTIPVLAAVAGARPIPWPVMIALLLFALPPALLAGAAAAVTAAMRRRKEGKRPLLLSPDLERAAREHFGTPSKQTIGDAIRSAEDGLRAEGDG